MGNQVKVLSEENIFVTAFRTTVKAMVFTAAALLLLTLFAAYGDIPDNTLSACVKAAAFISVFCAGLMVAGKRRKAGWLSGLVTGVIYVLVMIFAGFIIFGDFSLSADSVKMFFASIIGSVLGGIIGVNIKRKQK